MTQIEAEKIIGAIDDVCGFADWTMAEEIAKRLCEVIPEIEWTALFALIHAQSGDIHPS